MQRDQFLRADTLDGDKISAHIPGKLSKLRGVIYDVPLAMLMDERAQEVKGGKMVKAANTKKVSEVRKSVSSSPV